MAEEDLEEDLEEYFKKRNKKTKRKIKYRYINRFAFSGPELLPTLDNFPALKILIHVDDFTPGSTTFPARIGGFNLTLPNASGTKDGDGYYATTGMGGVIPADSALPIFGAGYLLSFASGKARTVSGFAGFTGTFGNKAAHGLTTAGLAAADAGGTTNALGAITVTTPGQKSGSVGYLDCVSAAAPAMYRTVANVVDGVFQAANTLTAGTNFQGMDSSVVDQTCELNAMFTADDNLYGGGRGIMIGLMDLAAPLTADELKLIAIWLASHPRTLPVFLRGRASA